MAIRGLILDLDATLIDSERLYSEALKSIGVDPGGKPFQEARAEVKRRLGEGHVSARNRLLYFRRMLEAEGRYTPAETLELTERYERKLAELFERNWRELGRAALVSELAARYPLVLLTNENTRTQMIKLRAIDPEARFFKHVIISEDWGVEKPDARLFVQAAAVLGCAPGECLMVGDDPASDIQGALKAGFRAVLTTEFKKPSGPVPAGVTRIEKLEELRKVLGL